MHNLDRNFLLVQLIHLIDNRLADMTLLLLRKLSEGTICTLPHCVDDLLNIERLKAAVLLDHLYAFLRMVLKTIIFPIRIIRFKFTAHTPLRSFVRLQVRSVFHKI